MHGRKAFPLLTGASAAGRNNRPPNIASVGRNDSILKCQGFENENQVTYIDWICMEPVFEMALRG